MNTTAQHISTHRSAGLVAAVNGTLLPVDSGMARLASLLSLGFNRQGTEPTGYLVTREIRAVAQGLKSSCW